MGDRKRSFEERLGDYPELKERSETILAIAEAEGNELKRADDAEQRAIEEVRKLATEVMQAWARRRESQLVTELTEEGPKVIKHGKKSLLAHHVRTDRDQGKDLPEGQNNNPPFL